MSRKLSRSNYRSFVTFCSIICVKHLNRALCLLLSLNSPDTPDYFIRPSSLYKNLQKWTSAINSFDTNFLSSFDIVSAVEGVSWANGFLPWFSMFFSDIFCIFWVLFNALGCNFLSDLSWLNILFSIDQPMFFGEEASAIILSNFCVLVAVLRCFSPKIPPKSFPRKLYLGSSSGLIRSDLSWLKALLKNYLAKGVNLWRAKISVIFSASIFLSNYFSFFARQGVSPVNISKKMIPRAQISLLKEY